MKKIAVLTSGGDAPGMNACLANLFTLCNRKNIELIGFKQGYVGLVDNDFIVITQNDIKNIYNLGGSVLKTGRSKEFLEESGQQKAISNLKNNQIDALIVIGGNGSYKGAQTLSKLGVKVICLPGTIDNDLDYTEKSLGFDTAVNNSVIALDKIKDTMSSNNRGVVVEVMGRNSGDIALYTATASNADAVIVKEIKDSKITVTDKIKKAIARGVESPTVVVAENIINITKLAKELEKETNVTFKPMALGYIQRGGSPTVFDRNYAMELAVKSIELLEKGIFNRVVGLKDGKIYDAELKTALSEKDNFNFALYDLFLKLNK